MLLSLSVIGSTSSILQLQLLKLMYIFYELRDFLNWWRAWEPCSTREDDNQSSLLWRVEGEQCAVACWKPRRRNTQPSFQDFLFLFLKTVSSSPSFTSKLNKPLVTSVARNVVMFYCDWHNIEYCKIHNCWHYLKLVQKSKHWDQRDSEKTPM